MKTSYIDHADYMEERYQDSLDGVFCPICGGSGRIPDEECVTDCECDECGGSGEVSRLRDIEIRKQKKETDYYGN